MLQEDVNRIKGKLDGKRGIKVDRSAKTHDPLRGIENYQNQNTHPL